MGTHPAAGHRAWGKQVYCLSHNKMSCSLTCGVDKMPVRAPYVHKTAIRANTVAIVDSFLFYFSPGSELACYAPKFSLGLFSVCCWADRGVAAIQHPPYVPQWPPCSEVHPALLGPGMLSSKPLLTPFSNTKPSGLGALRMEHFAMLPIRHAGDVWTESQTRGVHRAGGCDDVDSRPEAAGAIGDSFLALSPSPSSRLGCSRWQVPGGCGRQRRRPIRDHGCVLCVFPYTHRAATAGVVPF